MKAERTERTLQRGAAADVWRNTLSRVPTIYGRLVYLTSLRDHNTGRYEHHGLALVFGEDEAHSTLRNHHKKAFQEWLGFGLEQQKADLDLYLAGLFLDKRHVVESWLSLTPHKAVIPSSAKSVERRLFLSDFEALLELLRNEYGAGGPDPNA